MYQSTSTMPSNLPVASVSGLNNLTMSQAHYANFATSTARNGNAALSSNVTTGELATHSSDDIIALSDLDFLLLNNNQIASSTSTSTSTSASSSSINASKSSNSNNQNKPISSSSSTSSSCFGSSNQTAAYHIANLTSNTNNIASIHMNQLLNQQHSMEQQENFSTTTTPTASNSLIFYNNPSSSSSSSHHAAKTNANSNNNSDFHTNIDLTDHNLDAFLFDEYLTLNSNQNSVAHLSSHFGTLAQPTLGSHPNSNYQRPIYDNLITLQQQQQQQQQHVNSHNNAPSQAQVSSSQPIYQSMTTNGSHNRAKIPSSSSSSLSSSSIASPSSANSCSNSSRKRQLANNNNNNSLNANQAPKQGNFLKKFKSNDDMIIKQDFYPFLGIQNGYLNSHTNAHQVAAQLVQSIPTYHEQQHLQHNHLQQQQQQQQHGGNQQQQSTKYKRYDEFKCWVCGDQSSGNHYGALTCEACKLFFRRHSTAIAQMNSDLNASPNSASTSNAEIKPLTQCAQRNCQITINTRSLCPECRYRKCIAVGMGLNRTTFGRHTSIQKVKYNTRVSDLFAEILKLFYVFKQNLENTSCLGQEHLSHNESNLLIPIKLFNEFNQENINPASHTSKSTSNHKLIIVNKYNLELNLLNFYNQVIELMTPIQSNQLKNDAKLSFNLLITFCLIFGYNLVNSNNLNSTNLNSSNSSNANSNSTNNNSLPNVMQMKHLLKQISGLDKQFTTFALRVKIIYFLLIMYTSFNVNSMNNDDDFTDINNNSANHNQNISNSSNSPHLANGGNNSTSNGAPIATVQGAQPPSSSSSCCDLNIQRTFLDLLNSELDFQQNTVASVRVSLLLKLDQFI